MPSNVAIRSESKNDELFLKEDVSANESLRLWVDQHVAPPPTKWMKMRSVLARGDEVQIHDGIKVASDFL